MLVNAYLSGISTAAFAASGVFFLKFWIHSSDRFFALFALSFWLLALERFVLAVIEPINELGPLVYVPRLIAYLLILIAIVQKNTGRERT